jgi:hypothetical protein
MMPAIDELRMPESLQYQPSNSAVYYTPPQRVDVARALVGTVGAVALAIIGAILYAKFLPDVTYIVLRCGAFAGAALGAGILGMCAVHFGRVRVPVIAASIGALVGLVALYVMWVVWVHNVIARFGAVIPYWRFAVHPVALFHLVRSIDQEGTWSLDGSRIFGPPLAFIWACEAGAILAAAVFMPLKAMRDEEPVCKSCGQKCRSIGRLPRFAAECKSTVISAVENRDFESLVSCPAPEHQDSPELTLRVVSCPKCKQTNVLTVNHVGWGYENNRPKVVIKPLINQLLITSDEMERLTNVKAIIERQREGETIKDASNPPEGPTG